MKKKKKNDLVVMDIMLTGMYGIEAAIDVPAFPESQNPFQNQSPLKSTQNLVERKVFKNRKAMGMFET